jgi:hypothetical protein
LSAAAVLHCMLGYTLPMQCTPEGPCTAHHQGASKPQLASGSCTTYCHPGACQLVAQKAASGSRSLVLHSRVLSLCLCSWGVVHLPTPLKSVAFEVLVWACRALHMAHACCARVARCIWHTCASLPWLAAAVCSKSEAHACGRLPLLVAVDVPRRMGSCACFAQAST